MRESTNGVGAGRNEAGRARGGEREGKRRCDWLRGLSARWATPPLRGGGARHGGGVGPVMAAGPGLGHGAGVCVLLPRQQ